MGWWRTLLNLRDAPSPAQPMAQVERWARPITFTHTVPWEMSGEGAGGLYVRRVSRDQAMSVPAVKRGRDLICGTLGTLPLRQYDSRRIIVASELLDQPEEDVAPSVTYTRTVEDMLFEGRAWWRITAFAGNGYPAKVVRLEADSVNVRPDARVYVSSSTGIAQGQAMEWVPDAELIRIDSPHDPVLVAGARAIRASLALDRAAARYADDPLPLGYFTPADGVDAGDDEEIEEILDDFEDARSRRAWAYIGAGLKAHTLQWNPEQLQLSSARDYAVLELSRVMGIDPEDLGVSTTSRTYQNAEQRRMDLIDFTLAAYRTALEGRLSMPDVTPPGQYVRADPEDFQRADSLTRMQVYDIGRRVGVWNDERIARAENIPSARVQQPPPAQQPPAPAQPPRQEQEESSPVDNMSSGALQFASDEPAVTIGFAMPDAQAAFAADPATRTVSGMVVPWNVPAYSRGYQWMFAPGSLHWSAESRVKLDRDHEYGSELGRAMTLTNAAGGLSGSFKVARGAEGDRILALAEDGVYDGFSASVTFDAEADGWTAHPDNNAIRLVHSATLRKVAITAMPAFDDARVDAVAARREEGSTMTHPAAPAPAPQSPAAGLALGTALDHPQASAMPPAADAAAFTAGIGEAVRAAVEAAFARLPQPQAERQVVSAGRAVVQREAPVYLMNGHGPSLVRDSWKARTEHDHEAITRLHRFAAQTKDQAEQAMHPDFAVSTGNASQIVPPGYRPDLFVTQLMQDRPLVDSVSRGTLSDATPFNIPSFVSASGATAAHVEGTNPTGGTLTLGTVTVAPGAISGLFELNREIVDSANPAVDAIAMAAMRESYSQQTEALLYAQLNGTTGQGGTITNGFVPSGAQVSTTTQSGAGMGGPELIAGIRAALALYPFRRFAAPNRAHLSQEGTSALATAVGSDGRPLLPSVGAENTVGVGNAVTGGWWVDGLAFRPTWSMIGNAAGDADALFFNAADVWAWESPLLMFRFEERGGPARIDLALFAYFACRVLRPVGVAAVRHTDNA